MPSAAPAGAPLHVMAGVLLRDDGCVLLAERPAGKHLAGYWEFPGGKLEPDETPWAGLVRELREELGITVRDGTPLIALPWRYGELALLLDACLVETWDGAAASLEGQALRWCQPAQIGADELAPADRVILAALRRYLAIPGE